MRKFFLRFRKAIQAGVRAVKEGRDLAPIDGGALASLTRAIGDFFAGAWQQVADSPSADEVRAGINTALVYACIRALATDMAKMSSGVRRLGKDSKVWERATFQWLDRLLRRPNHFQTWFQFMFSWMASRLLAGNTYVVKLYQGSVVSELVVLDPTAVAPLVAHDTGEVFYRLSVEPLAGVFEEMIVAADDMMHDRYMPLGHPLMGTSPLERILPAARAREGIMQNVATLNENSSVPPGILYTPENMTTEQLKEMAELWRSIPKGRIAVISSSLKFETLASKAVDSQSTELASLAGTEICAGLGVPPWKVGIGARPTDVEASQINYFQDCLQWQKEDIEQTLDHGLDLPADVYLELDACSLYMMDSKTRAEVHKLLVGSAVYAPDEARREWDLPPVAGGATPYLQQQNYSLSALDARDKAAPAPSPGAPSPGTGGTGAGPEEAPDDGNGSKEPEASAPVLPWHGVYQAGREYPIGAFVTHKGSLWVRTGQVVAKPAEPGLHHEHWALCVKRGNAPQE